MKKAKPYIKREPSAVTIGNLEREKHNLILRNADLIEARDRNLRLANEREQRISDLIGEKIAAAEAHSQTCQLLSECQAKLASTEQEYAGYRRAVADMKS